MATMENTIVVQFHMMVTLVIVMATNLFITGMEILRDFFFHLIIVFDVSQTY